MKHFILSIFALFFAVSGFAQPFTLTMDGFRSDEDTTKDYIVIEVDSYDKATLFQRAKNYFTITYNSPQNVMSESGTDAISILGLAADISCKNGKMGGSFCDFSYKLVCEFREGRVKITPIWVNLVDDRPYYLKNPGGLNIGIYRKDGELRDEQAKAEIEQIINPLVLGLEQALKSESASTSDDNW